MCDCDCVALGAVDGGCVGELDELARVVGWDLALSTPALEPDAAVLTDVGHRPDLAICHSEGRIIAAGGDAVTRPDLLSTDVVTSGSPSSCRPPTL